MGKNKPNREEEDITPGGGYGIDGMEPDVEEEVNVYGDGAPEITLDAGADAQYSQEDLEMGAGAGAGASADLNSDGNPEAVLSASAVAHASPERLELGAGAEASVDIYDSELVDVNASAGASAGIHFSSGRTSVGADASAGGGVSLGDSSNQVAVGVGVGAGGGFEVIHGEDSDGDGQWEIGGSVNLKWGVGGSLSFRVEPEEMLARAREFMGLSKRDSTPAGTPRLSDPIAMRRLDEAYARLQSCSNN